jgi:hypothetical protein
VRYFAYDWGFRARSSLQAAAVKAIAGTCARSAGHRGTFYGITAPYRKGRGFGGKEVVKEHLTSAHGAYVARPILSVADAAALTVMKIHYNAQDTSLRAIFARQRPFAPYATTYRAQAPTDFNTAMQ